MKACRENSVATSSYRCEAEAWELKVGSRLTAVSHVRSLGDRSSWGWSFKSQGCFGVQVKKSVAVRRFVEAKQLLNQSDGTPFECQVRRSNMPLVG
jgi:hypothetical protein